MDILRKELNEIYAAQHLEWETLDAECVARAKNDAESLVKISGACAVVTDAAADRCHIYGGRFGGLMGLGMKPGECRETDSSDEDEIYIRIHPEDLVEKRMLEYELFKLIEPLSGDEKKRYKATCRIRMRDAKGEYLVVANSTQVTGLSPNGKMWLILCCYDLCPEQGESDGIAPYIVDNGSGEIIGLNLGERRKHVLTEREKEILRLIRDGKPSKQIADKLGISVHTVNRHRQNIIEKLSVGNSIEAVMAASAMRLL